MSNKEKAGKVLSFYVKCVLVSIVLFNISLAMFLSFLFTDKSTPQPAVVWGQGGGLECPACSNTFSNVLYLI